MWEWHYGLFSWRWDSRPHTVSSQNTQQPSEGLDLPVSHRFTGIAGVSSLSGLGVISNAVGRPDLDILLAFSGRASIVYVLYLRHWTTQQGALQGQSGNTDSSQAVKYIFLEISCVCVFNTWLTFHKLDLNTSPTKYISEYLRICQGIRNIHST